MRIDQLLVKRGFTETRTKANALVKEGVVFVRGKLVTKPAQDFYEEVEIEVRKEKQWVSRGAEKILSAIEKWGIEIKGKVCADIGSSTGGFTEVLLSRGAKKVYAIDVGRDQLHQSLRQDERVVSFEETDIREFDLNKIKEPVKFICADISFASLSHILPSIHEALAPKGEAVVLVKPQFELLPEDLKKGIVRDSAKHGEVLEKIKKESKKTGFKVKGEMESPILGKGGNKEFLLYLSK